MGNEDMSDNGVLTAAAYESLVLAGLERLGMTPDQARDVSAGRWPMTGAAAVCECRGRGLELCLEDLTDFLVWKFERLVFDDGAPIDAEAIGWSPRILDESLQWAVANGRGTLANDAPEEPELLPSFVSVAAMLEALHSPDLLTRLQGGFRLAQSLGAGLALQGEDRLDIEHIVAPGVSKLIGAAIAGDAGALEELESHITIENPARATAREE